MKINKIIIFNNKIPLAATLLTKCFQFLLLDLPILLSIKQKSDMILINSNKNCTVMEMEIN